MRETTDEFAARGMRLWHEHILQGINRALGNEGVWQSAEYVCYDEPVRTRVCETCRGTGVVKGKILVVECPFGCEEMLPE